MDSAVRVEADDLSLNKRGTTALVYGSEMILYLDGKKISTWTQYNGRLDSSTSSPLSLGIARAGSDNWGNRKGLMAGCKSI